MSKSVVILAATASLLIGVTVYYLVASKKKKKNDEEAKKINGFLQKANITVKPPQPAPDESVNATSNVTKPLEDLAKTTASKNQTVFEVRRGHDVEWIDVNAQKKFEFGVADENLDKIVSSLITEPTEESDMTQSVADSFASLIGEGPEACLVKTDVHQEQMASCYEQNVHQVSEIKKAEVSKDISEPEVVKIQTPLTEIEETELVKEVVIKNELEAGVEIGLSETEAGKEIEDAEPELNVQQVLEIKKSEVSKESYISEPEVVKIQIPLTEIEEPELVKEVVIKHELEAGDKIGAYEPEVGKEIEDADRDFQSIEPEMVKIELEASKTDNVASSPLVQNVEEVMYENEVIFQENISFSISPNPMETSSGDDNLHDGIDLDSVSFEQFTAVVSSSQIHNSEPAGSLPSLFEHISLPLECFERMEPTLASIKLEDIFEEKSSSSFEQNNKPLNSNDQMSDKSIEDVSSTFSGQIIESGASSMVADAIVEQIVGNVFVVTANKGEELASKPLKVTETDESFTSGLVDSPKSSDVTWAADDENGNFSDRSETLSDDVDDDGVEEDPDEPVWNHSVSGKTSAPEKPIRKKLPAEVLKEENEEGEGGGGQLLETATEF